MATNFAGEPLDPTRDLLGIAVRGMLFAVAIGTLVVALVLWTVQQLVPEGAASGPPVASGPAALLLLVGTLTAVLTSGGLAWRRLAALGSSYRRGALALVCAFATFVAALLAAPLHYFLGRPGLLGLAAVGGLIAFLVRRPVSR